MRKAVFLLFLIVSFCFLINKVNAQKEVLIYSFGTDWEVTLDSVRDIYILIKSNVSYTKFIVVGLTIGEDWNPGLDMFEGFSCNEFCYVDDYVVDYLGRKWVDFVALGPYETYVASVKFKYKYPYFQVGKTYDVVIKVWEDVRNISDPGPEYVIDRTWFFDAITIVEKAPDAKILEYSFPPEAMQEQIISVRAVVKNTGNVKSNLYVGMSIGDKDTGKWCNRLCYADGLGDYAVLYDVEPGGVRIAERKFKIRRDMFESGKYYDVRIGVYEQPYLPWENAIDKVERLDAIYIRKLEVNAYAVRISVDKAEVAPKGIISITAWVYNAGTISYNFTLGMSIGLWDVQHGIPYPSPQYALIPPCNTECYKDGLGSWVYRIIPPNFTVPFTRVFEVPDYFPVNNTFDVAVGVWLDEGETPVSITYFKNVSFVSYIVPPEVQIREFGRTTTQEILNFIETSLGVKREYSKMIFWLIITSAISISAIAIPAYISRSSPPWQIGLVVLLIMLILGAIVRDEAGPFMPYWLVILFIILGAFIGAKTLHEIFGGK